MVITEGDFYRNKKMERDSVLFTLHICIILSRSLQPHHNTLHTSAYTKNLSSIIDLAVIMAVPYDWRM